MIFSIFGSLTAFAAEPVGESPVHSVDDLEGSKIGVQLGTTGDTYATDYEGDEAGTEIVRFNKGADAVQALKQGKLDCVLIDEQPAIEFVAKNTDLSILDEEFTLEDYAICTAKDNTQLRDKINGAITELKEEGVLDDIINNYIDDDLKGTLPYTLPEGIEYTGTLTMATNAAFPPYEFYEGNDIVGIDADIATAIADKLGMKLEISDIEFDSIIIAVQTGKADFGMAGMTVTEDRLKNIDFSETYITTKQVIIVRNGEGEQKQSFTDKVKSTFIDKGRWKYIPRGLANTLIITVFAGVVGVFLGFILAIVRVSYDRNDERNIAVKILNAIAKIYLTVFRGTPVMVQLLIMYYVVFSGVNINPIIVAVIAFGLNSAAYVAEAVRAGIISIPIGQFEAGRSLGFTFTKTMLYIIMPQAIKNSLPAMCNEFIALLKESSIVGYIGLMDLTKAGDIIRSNTYEALIPLCTVALVYLVIVMILTKAVGMLERRLKKDER